MTAILQSKTWIPILQIGAFLYVPLLYTAWIYWQGLGGPFLFDDMPHFETLLHLQHHDNLDRMILFALTGDAGPTGRPISMLSFLINDYAWPSNPYGFKYTNLMIHLLNGTLLFWLWFRLLNLLGISNSSSISIAGISALVWLIHPVLISNVLYVVQRMNQLSTLFILGGIIAYLYARPLINTTRYKGYTLATLSLVCFGLLAIYSKENGLLLPVYILSIELCLRDSNKTLNQYKGFQAWKVIFLYIPTLIIFCYLIVYFSPHTKDIRSFTGMERFITEFRVLSSYISQLVMPQMGGTGVFHDDYQASTSLVTPATTLPAILFILGLIFAGIKFRRKKPIISFAIFWFLGGHLLESTTLNLELYFEHRNYLPYAGPLFSLIYLIFTNKQRLKTRGQLITDGLLVLFIGLLSFISYQSSWLWGNHFYAAPIWAMEKPNSIRAQEAASAVALMQGDRIKGKVYLEKAFARHPDEVGLALSILYLQCNLNQTELKIPESYFKVFKSGIYSHGAVSSAINLSLVVSKHKCKQIKPATLINILKLMINNHEFRHKKAQHALNYWLGMLYAAERQLNPAIQALDRAHATLPVIDIPLQQAIWLSSAGLHQEALEYINVARTMQQRIRNPLFKNVRADDINNLEQLIIKAMSNTID